MLTHGYPAKYHVRRPKYLKRATELIDTCPLSHDDRLPLQSFRQFKLGVFID